MTSRRYPLIQLDSHRTTSTQKNAPSWRKDLVYFLHSNQSQCTSEVYWEKNIELLLYVTLWTWPCELDLVNMTLFAML